eukprot:TRINITY_DN4587_c0_g1_i1.p1 TRINITY_DN4587_c0_g1~~TRINITY_DN4587_c0_g1_i1.p1  ORF type:complete len:306 (+),score=22.60 TRINITY_DN4587_c0_g1_i1:2-919(+)
MAFLYNNVSEASDYGIRNWVRQGRDPEEYKSKLATSTTVYVGNLSFYTTEEQIWELFSKVGEVKRIIMGLNQFTKTPCGFSFVEYFTHEAAMDCVNLISGTTLDERTIRADWDTGFEEGRQFGRGKTGGQVRDDYRTDFDPERGGAGGRPITGDRYQGDRHNKRDRSGEFKSHDRRYSDSSRHGHRSYDADSSRSRDYGHRESSYSSHRHEDDRDRRDRERPRDYDRSRDEKDRYRERGLVDRRDDRDDHRQDRYDSRDRQRQYGDYHVVQKDAFGRDIPPPESFRRETGDEYSNDRDVKRPKYS